MSERKQRWIQLNDPDGARLKIMPYNKGASHYLVISGVAPRSELFQRLIQEAGYVASNNGGLLIRKIRQGELVNPDQFKPFWPEVTSELMGTKEFILPDPTVVKAAAPVAQSSQNAEQEPNSSAAETQDVQSAITAATYLGWNASGEKVYERASGRFVVSADEVLIEENESLPRPMFLRCRTSIDLRQNVAGLLVAVEKGEPIRETDLARFVKAIWAKDLDQLTDEQWVNMASALDTLMASTLLNNSTSAPGAWSDATYFEQMIPVLDIIRKKAAQTSASLPLAVLTHRLVGAPQTGQVVRALGPVSPINFGLFAEPVAVQQAAPEAMQVYWSKATFRLDENTPNDDIKPAHIVVKARDAEQANSLLSTSIGQLEEDGTVVVQVELNASPGGLDSATKQWLLELENKGVVEQVFDIPQWLLRDGTESAGVRLVLFRKTDVHRRRDFSQKTALPVVDSWDMAKTLVDETLVRLQRPDEGTDDSISLDYLTRAENKLQRPYLAMSRIGPASTMVPKNIQSSLSYALDALEQEYGQIDEFVSAELGFGKETLADSFSPEQIDAVGLGVRRLLANKGFIIGDETGIGKGRVISAFATWALKNRHPVIFITDRSTLFSDLARDLNDIGEWHRFRPLITNADGDILDMGDGGRVLASATPAGELKKMMASGASPWETGANIVFTTYSQLSQENSAKWAWLKKHCADALIIADESHIAAGADSNTANQISDLTTSAWSVVYSSATWARNAQNLRLYARAFPENMSVSVLSDLMARGGHDFAEIFSSMLAMDGAFIRREHDLSKIEFNVLVDEAHFSRNEQVVAKVSEVLGMMAMLSGEVNHALQRMNQQTQQAITQANKAYERIRALVGGVSESEAMSRIDQRKQVIQAGLEELELARVRAHQQNLDRMAVTVLYRDPQSADAVQNIEEFGLMPSQGPQIQTIETINEWVTQSQADLRLIEEFERSQSAFAQTMRSNAGHLFKSSFGTGSAIYQAMRRTMAAVLVDQAVERAIQAVREDRKPVIVFEETGETFVRQFIEQELQAITEQVKQARQRGDDRLTRALADQLATGTRVDELVKDIRMPVIADLMRSLLARIGGVSVSEPDTMQSNKGAEAARIKAISSLKEVPGLAADLIDKFEQGVQKIAEQINQLPALPIVPVDAIRAKLAAAGITIKEVSGRNYQLDPVDAQDLSGRVRITRRDRSKTQIMKSVSDFNNDPNTHALIINVAAATGLSMHASPRFANTNQRELIEFQIPESAITRVQLLGRVNRFDQVIPPKISILTAGLFAEYRSLMMQNRKLQDLSANIRSSRDNAAVIDSVPDILNPIGDRVCTEFLMENPSIASRLDIDIRRLQNYHGMASLLTQRLVLLAPAAQKTVYDEIVEAYEDALLEQSLEEGGIDNADWRASTVSTRKAWGPPEELALTSAFDSPVYFKLLEYTEDYQPMTWDDIEQRVQSSTQALSSDERVTSQFPPGVVQARIVTDQVRGTPQEHENVFVASLIESLAKAQAEARVVGEPALEDRADQDGVQDPVVGLQTLGGKWVAVSAYHPGRRQHEAYAGLVSRSGHSMKLYNLHEGRARVYYLNLGRAIHSSTNGDIGQSLRLERTLSYDKSHWLYGRFAQCWRAPYPAVTLPDLSAVVSKADRVFDAKKVMALADAGAQDIEQALAQPEENSVKLVHKRQLFVKHILPKLVPGQIMTVEPDDGRFNFFQDRWLVVGVDLPPVNRETSLSKWKLHLVRPGDTRVQTVSAASLMKISEFKLETEPGGELEGRLGWRSLIDVRSNVFDAFRGVQARQTFIERLAMHTPGPRTRRQSVLAGNMFEAEQWARATRLGRAIMYSDELGIKHRAVLIKKNAWGARQDLNGVDFPIRLSNTEMVRDFVRLCHHHYFDSVTGEGAQPRNVPAQYVAATSFRAAVDLGRDGELKSDALVYNPSKSVLMIEMNKSEKDKNVRAMRAAFAQDRLQWCQERGEDSDSPNCTYPFNFRTRSQRTPASQSTTYVGMQVPVDRDELAQFMTIVGKALGLQLYVPRNQWRTRHLAEQVEQTYYVRLGQRLEQERREKLEAAERRRHMLQTLDLAFDEPEPQVAPDVDELMVGDLLEGLDAPDAQAIRQVG
ncbi:hypothetical protein PuT2_11460 [Pusillimonas sp. T2]|uniref:strawberry notch-like NTP hydrolase domain-containing protein n=1 Tax=Pusillimonas sp. T2 TaxID=1548123 RepID=UPI000B9CD819|nr:strawberry notch family protein [Pusillimonas sp. T2]OXR48584.1 hypothetical protein PuT2_11460 [Pusillimonas sp. T2]